MTVQAWERIKELLHQAMQLDDRQRGQFLDEVCASDAALRIELESLLAADEGLRSSFLHSSPLADASDPYRGTGKSTLKPGQTFAEHFILIGKLGEGGMGQVWLAEQIFPMRRQVALKLIKAGMYDEAVVERFQSERQSLAIMDHPSIAKVFDAGSTPQGQPYFVMEYVPGLPITEYCDEKRLKIHERLELFIQVCEGVQHAHQKAILHRDLKPANMLVVEVDGRPTAHIIDFGLAKAIAPSLADDSVVTLFGHFVGTPGYMSPEQADPRTRDIDTRTDVYSLGVVLYVLLAGLQPFETRQQQKPSIEELLRRLREEEPPRPSTKISADRKSSVNIARARGAEVKQLVSQLYGDLDWITMKALEKDRGRRYGTPSDLAADIQRYLNHEPVAARPASAVYRLRKYVRRHRVAVGVASGLVLLLAAFSILQAVQLHRTTEERDRANRERDRATRITDFMTGMFKVSDPGEARGNSVTAREVLDKASVDMGAGLAKDPEVQADMMQVMAETYRNLGLYPRAHELAKRALDARTALLGTDDPKTLESLAQLGSVLEREGHADDAEKLEREAFAGERRVLGPEDPRALETMHELALILEDQGHFSEAEKLEREAIGIASRTLGSESPQVLASMGQLGSSLWYQARYTEAEQEYRKLLEMDRRVWGPDHPRTLAATLLLARAIDSQGRSVEAEHLYREYLAASQRTLGPEHRNVAIAMQDLATLLIQEGRLSEGEKLSRQTLAIRARTLGPEHPETLLAQENLVDLLVKEGRYHEAEKLQRQTLAIQLRILGPEDPNTLGSQSNLAGILIPEGRYAEAERIARETLAIENRKLGPLHPDALQTLQQLATALADTHRYAEARAMFRNVIDQDNGEGKQGNRWTAWYDFACMAAASNHREDALKYLHEAIERGYTDADSLMADEDLKNLHRDARFKELVAELRRAHT
jgi:serine/threonine protein kinase/tetratricopeptide (TPR) repeat protein